MDDSNSKHQDDENSGSAKAPVFKNKEEYKREVNRLRSIKNERKMKMTDRLGDVLPSPGKHSLSTETYYQEDAYSEPDATDYLNTLLSNPEDKEPSRHQQLETSQQLAEPDEPEPLVPADCTATLLVGIVLAAVVAFFIGF